MKSASQRIGDVAKRLDHEGALPPGNAIYPNQAIRLALAVGLAIAQAIHEVAGEVAEAANAIRESQL